MRLFLALAFFASACWGANNFNILDSSSVTVSGGTINGATIGQTTAAAGSFTTLSSSSAVTEIPRTAAYQWTAWNPSDVAGTFTNASSSAAASLTATGYMTMANASGTLTYTFTKAGNYLVSVSCLNASGAAATFLAIRLSIGGTATRYYGPTTANLLYASDSGGVTQGGSLTFLASATADQTVTLLPATAVTSGGAVGSFATNCSATATYVGT